MAQRFFTSVKAFEEQADPKPSKAEVGLIAAVRNGEPYRHAATRPTAQTPDNTVRASLLRLLILGGTPDCGLQPVGVWLDGAWIEGVLDLQFCIAQGRTALKNCHFVKRPELAQAHLKELCLDGSRLERGLFAQGARIEGSVFLTQTQAAGTVDLNNATIGGQLACGGASLSGLRDAEGAVTGLALNAQGAKIGASVFLSHMKAVGTVDLNAATIRAQLSFTGSSLSGPRNADGAGTGFAVNVQLAAINGHVLLRRMQAVGTVNLLGATIEGQLDCGGATLSGPRNAEGAVRGKALLAQSVAIKDGLHFRQVTSVAGDIDLTSAHCRVLVDDADSWERCDGDLYLDGFTYDRIGPISPTTLALRRAWLRRGATKRGTFYPQPYTQFAKVLRETGHGAEARRVLIASVEHRHDVVMDGLNLRAIKLACPAKSALTTTRAMLRPLKRLMLKGRAFPGIARLRFRQALLMTGDRILRWTIGYGYAPLRSLWVLALLIGIGWLLAHLAWEEGSFAPNAAPILVSEGWAAVQGADNPAEVWSNTRVTTTDDPMQGADWETFWAPAYAFDVVVPIIDIGQTQAWAPSTERGPWGKVLWAGRWVLTVLGWIVTALGAAAVTGIVQRGQPD